MNKDSNLRVGGPRRSGQSEAETTVVVVAGNSESLPSETYECKYCKRHFDTKTGCGVHMKKMHGAEMNRLDLPANIKVRWSEEEETLMAKEEVRLTIAGEVNLNTALKEYLPNRSMEAVKGKRRNDAYKALVKSILDQVNVSQHGSIDTVTTGKTGYSLEENSTEPNRENLQTTQSPEIGSSQSRWSKEEQTALAVMEAQLTRANTRNMNKALNGRISGRTLESIKNMRKRPKYKALVVELLEKPNSEQGLSQEIEGSPKCRERPIEGEVLVNQIAQVPPPLMRWSQDEELRLAEEEVRMIKDGVKNINFSLSRLFINRTSEAIKGHRKQVCYQNLVKTLSKKTYNVNDDIRVPNQTLAEGVEYCDPLPGTHWMCSQDKARVDSTVDALKERSDNLVQCSKSLEMGSNLTQEEINEEEETSQERIGRSNICTSKDKGSEIDLMWGITHKLFFEVNQTSCPGDEGEVGTMLNKQRDLILQTILEEEVHLDEMYVEMPLRDKERETTLGSPMKLNSQDSVLLKDIIEIVDQEVYVEVPLNDKEKEATLGSPMKLNSQDRVLLKDIMEIVDQEYPPTEEELSNVDKERKPIKEHLGWILRNAFPENFNGKYLLEIVKKAINGEDILRDLSHYLDQTFPPSPKKPVRRQVAIQGGTRKEKKKREYAHMQNLYRKDRNKCAAEILDGTRMTDKFGLKDFQEAWEPVFMDTPIQEVPEVDKKEDPITEIWNPITELEILRLRIEKNTAPGPDGTKSEELSKMPIRTLCTLFNLLMICGRLPERLNLSRTIFIPKSEHPESAKDFRPLSITSVITRQLHKIFAERLKKFLPWDERQRGFMEADGCAENVTVLAAIIQDAHDKLRPLYLGSVDIKKAFDSVSHRGVLQAMRRLRCPESFLQYYSHFQEDGKTILCSHEDHSEPISINCGVRQGDPISPYAFNAVIDQMFEALPEGIGYDLNPLNVNKESNKEEERWRVNCLGFADDLVPVASSKPGLQKVLTALEEFLVIRNLCINATKTRTIALQPVGKKKKMHVAEHPLFKMGGVDIPMINVEDSWKYLGVKFTPKGKTILDMSDLVGLLDKLQKAPLKPQQRMFLLRIFLLPKFYYRAVFSKITAGQLENIDIKIRQTVARWLQLPHDTPIAFFHADYKDGGMSVPSFRWTIPRLKLDRLNAMQQSKVGYVRKAASTALHMKIRLSMEKMLVLQDRILRSKLEVREKWAQDLYSTVDGNGLRECADVPQAHGWVVDGTSLLSGKDYVQAIKLRINALPTRSRLARGRRREKRCRAGCVATETLAHILQQCPRTHGARVKRHDGLLKLTKKYLEEAGHTVMLEPHFQTEVGLRKPDLVVASDSGINVIDCQVVGEFKSLREQDQSKRLKYCNNKAIKDQLISRFPGKPIDFGTVTISWRGIINDASARLLLSLGIRKSNLKILALRVIQGGEAEFGVYNRMTTRVERGDVRSGIG